MRAGVIQVVFAFWLVNCAVTVSGGDKRQAEDKGPEDEGDVEGSQSKELESQSKGQPPTGNEQLQTGTAKHPAGSEGLDANARAMERVTSFETEGLSVKPTSTASSGGYLGGWVPGVVVDYGSKALGNLGSIVGIGGGSKKNKSGKADPGTSANGEVPPADGEFFDEGWDDDFGSSDEASDLGDSSDQGDGEKSPANGEKSPANGEGAVDGKDAADATLKKKKRKHRKRSTAGASTSKEGASISKEGASTSNDTTRVTASSRPVVGSQHTDQSTAPVSPPADLTMSFLHVSAAELAAAQRESETAAGLGLGGTSLGGTGTQKENLVNDETLMRDEESSAKVPVVVSEGSVADSLKSGRVDDSTDASAESHKPNTGLIKPSTEPIKPSTKPEAADLDPVRTGTDPVNEGAKPVNANGRLPAAQQEHHEQQQEGFIAGEGVPASGSGEKSNLVTEGEDDETRSKDGQTGRSKEMVDQSNGSDQSNGTDQANGAERLQTTSSQPQGNKSGQPQHESGQAQHDTAPEGQGTKASTQEEKGDAEGGEGGLTGWIPVVLGVVVVGLAVLGKVKSSK